MFFILAVILIAIGGIVFMLFFDEKPKVVTHQEIDSSNIPINQNTTQPDEIRIVFDEPTDIRHINITIDPTNKISEDVFERNKTTSSENREALITNSKINPFNF